MKQISALCLFSLLYSCKSQEFLSIETDAKDDACVAPGICTPPDTQFSKVAPLNPRAQWTTDGGFCGALSIQSIALTFGTYISQDIIRKAAPYGGGHGQKNEGYEVLPVNIG